MDDSIFDLQYADSVPLLSKAVKVGDLKKVRKLLLEGWQPQTPDNRGWTAIHCCVAENQLKALRLILKFNPKSQKYLVNLATWKNVTPLHISLKVAKPSFKMVRFLLKAGANPKQYTLTNLSPLHLACMKKGNLQFVKLLVRYGADVNVQEDLALFTPLHVAVCEGCDSKVIQFLLNSSDLSMKNVYGRTAFLKACNLNSIETVKLFLEKDKNLANINYGLPPLAYAGIVGNIELTQLLLDSGADVNIKCKAMVSYEEHESELIILDREKFLPIHSSLTNVEVFKMLLRLTKSNELLLLETNYYSFPLFVMVYGGETFLEALLQSDLPNQLKTISSQVLVKFILCYPDMKDSVIKKFSLIFKYNFNLEPDNVLQNFLDQMSVESLCENYKFLHLLAQMGVLYGFENKKRVVNILENFMLDCKDEKHLDVIRSTCDLLSQSVLSLKQYCRIVIRQRIKISVRSHWLALKSVEEFELPDSLKNFLTYEAFM